MTQQVITIAPDGTMSGLQHKPGKGIDLRKFGKASIKRASEVLYCEDTQLWYVELRIGYKVPRELDTPMLGYADPDGTIPVAATGPRGRAYFTEYDVAVRAEIAVLNNIRLQEGGPRLLNS